jgi:hypothetical protein
MAIGATKGNLDARARNTQLRGGVLLIALTLVGGVALSHFGASREARMFLFLPFFFGTYGLTASMGQVCGVTAIRGRRWTIDGVEKVHDREELARLRRSGSMAMAVSALVAVLATLSFVFAR